MGLSLMEFILLGLSALVFTATFLDLLIALRCCERLYAKHVLAGWVWWQRWISVPHMWLLTTAALSLGCYEGWGFYCGWWLLQLSMLIVRFVLAAPYIRKRCRRLMQY